MRNDNGQRKRERERGKSNYDTTRIHHHDSQTNAGITGIIWSVWSVGRRRVDRRRSADENNEGTSFSVEFMKQRATVIIAPSPEMGEVSYRSAFYRRYLSASRTRAPLPRYSPTAVYGRPSLYRNYSGLIGRYIKRERPSNTLSRSRL